MVSIKDIAKQAGVAISTVSYALNNSPKVTEKTRSKILAIAEELNYVPNAAARTLKKRHTKIIGAYFTDYGGSFFGELLRGMRRLLNEKGYDLIACTGKESHRFLPEGIIDGAVILDNHFPDEKIIAYADRGHRIVVLDREIDHPNIECVLLDNKMGAELAINFLINQGHKNLILLTGSEESFDSNKRLEAAKKILKQHPSINYSTIQGHFDKESGEEAAKKIVIDYSSPVAIFSFNDEMAIGIYNYLKETPYHIGEHIHVIGFDDIELTNYIEPLLSTIHYSKEEWGKEAAEQLLNLIKNKTTKSKKIKMELTKGDSVNKLT